MPPKRRRQQESEPSSAPVTKRSRRGKVEPEEEEEKDFAKLSVFELKRLCKSRGLPNTGRKAELIARLEESEGNEGNKGKKKEEKEEEKEEENEGENEGENGEENEGENEEEKVEKEEKKPKRKAPVKKEPVLPEEYDFSGKRFVITGEFARGKSSIIGMLVGKGAVEASSVSGTTSFCVLGKAGVSDYGQKTGPGTKKHKDAKKKKCLIVNEDWVIKICEGGEGGGDVESVMKEKWDKLVEAMEKAGNTKEVEPPATEEALRETEARIGFPIPAQYRALLKVTNGGFSSESSWGKSCSFPRAEEVNGGDNNDFFTRFYKALRMVSFGEYVHVSSSGIVFEWDTSFDGQCGNTIVSNSVADYLDTWTKQVEESGEAKDFKRDWDTEVEIDKSTIHKSFFSRFKSNYERNFGRWPQYVS